MEGFGYQRLYFANAVIKLEDPIKGKATQY